MRTPRRTRRPRTGFHFVIARTLDTLVPFGLPLFSSFLGMILQGPREVRRARRADGRAAFRS